MIPLLAFHPPVIAHRGASAVAPENTLAAIHQTREQGANWLELDVKITYDGIPVLLHDETLNRTTDGAGFIAEAAWRDIKDLDAGSKFDVRFGDQRIPRLSDALNAILQDKLSLIIELKPCPGRTKATTMVTMIELSKFWPEGDIYPVISSFDVESLEMAAQLEPHWPRCLIMNQWDSDWREKMERVGACAISVDEAILTRDRVEEINTLRLPLLSFTVNDPARAKDLLAWGVAAVYADNPRAILSALLKA